MRLNLRDYPPCSRRRRVPFRFPLDLSGLDFYGERPFADPVQVTGTVRNHGRMPWFWRGRRRPRWSWCATAVSSPSAGR